MKQVFQLACKIVLSDDMIKKVDEELERCEHQLPAPRLLDDASHRVVYMDLLFQRELHQDFDFTRHWSIDSSPQGGYDFMVTMEDRCAFKNTTDVATKINTKACYTTRHLPVVTLGWGASSLAYKTAGAHHALALESGSWSRFDKARHEVRSFTSDGGTERNIVNAPILYDEGFKSVQTVLESVMAKNLQDVDQAAFFLPNAILVLDFLHVIYNAFEEASTRHQVYQQCQPHLQALCAFLAVRDLRNAYVTKCCPVKHRQLLSQWSINTGFSWKWEYLQRFLMCLLPRLDILIDTFDAQKLSKAAESLEDDSEDAGKFAAKISAAALALKWPPLKSVCLVLEVDLHWLEAVTLQIVQNRSKTLDPKSDPSRVTSDASWSNIDPNRSNYRPQIGPNHSDATSPKSFKKFDPELDPNRANSKPNTFHIKTSNRTRSVSPTNANVTGDCV